MITVARDVEYKRGTTEEEIMNHEGYKKTSANLRDKTVLSLINIY